MTTSILLTKVVWMMIPSTVLVCQSSYHNRGKLLSILSFSDVCIILFRRSLYFFMFWRHRFLCNCSYLF